jgi:hypothetical protein
VKLALKLIVPPRRKATVRLSSDPIMLFSLNIVMLVIGILSRSGPATIPLY